MNIEFKSILNGTINQLRENWSSIMKNVLLYLALVFIVIVPVLLVVVIIAFIVPTSAVLIVFSLVYGIFAFVGVTAKYAVADASMTESRNLFIIIKMACTFSNFKFALKSLILPIVPVFFIAMIIAFLPTLVGTDNWSEVIGSVQVVISLVDGPILECIAGYYIIAIYVNPDTKVSRELLRSYSKKEIIIVYLKFIAVVYLFSIPFYLISFIPILGSPIMIVGNLLFSTAAAQTLILELRGRFGVEIDYRSDQVTSGFTANNNVTIENAGAEIASVRN